MFSGQAKAALRRGGQDVRGTERELYESSQGSSKWNSSYERTTKSRKDRASAFDEVDRTGVGLWSNPKFEITLATMAVTKRPVHKSLVSSITLSFHSEDRKSPMLRPCCCDGHRGLLVLDYRRRWMEKTKRPVFAFAVERKVETESMLG